MYGKEGLKHSYFFISHITHLINLILIGQLLTERKESKVKHRNYKQMLDN